MKKYIFLILLFLSQSSFAQTYFGKVLDESSKEPLPFATLKLNDGKQGIVTDLHGKFELKDRQEINKIEISYLGYQSYQILNPSPKAEIIILLKPNANSLKEFVVKPPFEKINRIIKNTIANKTKNNPDLYRNYNCNVYYKMVFDIRVPDSTLQIMKQDTSNETQSFVHFVENQHALMSETYSKRYWQQPKQLQEIILASKLSGFQKSLFNSLVTDILPFHAYDNYLKLNNIDYHNPICAGFEQRYNFNIIDELLQDKDTIWVLSFKPKKNASNCLKGTIYIHSDGFAITNFLAQAKDTNLKRIIKLEQQYTRNQNNQWFPRALNYILDWERIVKRDKKDTNDKRDFMYSIVATGTSVIDSVSINSNEIYKIDKSKTVKLLPDANEKNEAFWSQLRPTELNPKEKRTYEFTDSLFDAIKVNKYIPYLEKLVEGKVPIYCFDLELERLYRWNKYEQSRIGIGFSTNDKISKLFSIGAWSGYGTRDKQWKYGADIKFYLDQFKEKTLSFSYAKDLKDPGRIKLNKELGNTYIQSFIISRVDESEEINASFEGRANYLNYQLSLNQTSWKPLYDYFLVDNQFGLHHQFTAKEISLQLRYAFAERRAPLFGKYYATSDNYPIVYAKINVGTVEDQQFKSNYWQFLLGTKVNLHINRLGKEQLQVVMGYLSSNNLLPLGKLFAGNGYRFDENSFYSFGGMMTMLPYEYYSDKFINIYWQHDFDWHLFSNKFSHPFFSIGHNLLYGTMANRKQHLGVFFKTPDQSYHESGVCLNNLLRIKYMDLYYLTLNTGYYIHWAKQLNIEQNGRWVFGLGFEF